MVLLYLYKKATRPNLSSASTPCNPGAKIGQSCLEFAHVSPHSRIRLRGNGHTSSPDLLVINLVQLLLEILAVSLPSIELQTSSGFGSILYGLVQSLEDGLVSFLEDGRPVKGASSCSRRARL
jgi:hypothetical protein